MLFDELLELNCPVIFKVFDIVVSKVVLLTVFHANPCCVPDAAFKIWNCAMLTIEATPAAPMDLTVN